MKRSRAMDDGTSSRQRGRQIGRRREVGDAGHHAVGHARRGTAHDRRDLVALRKCGGRDGSADKAGGSGNHDVARLSGGHRAIPVSTALVGGTKVSIPMHK